MPTIYDPSLASHRVANGRSVGVLEGLEANVLPYVSVDLSDLRRGWTDDDVENRANALPFSNDYLATGAATGTGGLGDLSGVFDRKVSAKTQEFVDNIAQVGSVLVGIRRAFAKMGSPPEDLRDRYNTLKAAWLRALYDFHKENPKLPREAIKIPGELLGASLARDYSKWATVTGGATGVKGLGELGEPITIGAIIVISLITVATTITVSPVLYGYSKKLRAEGDVLAAAANAANEGRMGDAKAILDKYNEGTRKPGLWGLTSEGLVAGFFRMSGVQGFVVNAVSVGAAGFLAYRYGVPALMKKVRTRRTRRRRK